jgi:hypothetical protein
VLAKNFKRLGLDKTCILYKDKNGKEIGLDVKGSDENKTSIKKNLKEKNQGLKKYAP